jgi:beta-lactamase regulating signal transducer with metallopeptidase domain
LAAAAPWWTSIAWPELALAVAAAVASVGLGWLCLVHHRLRTVLRARRPETDARVLTTAAEVARSLGMQQSPHVSRSAAIATPIAFGLLRPEVCLPARVGELSHASLRAMLAHEVAHLRAADPAWMWGAVWLQALFAWQPLFVVVRRRWARLVELRCDAIAAEHATPTAVARCLLDVADWLRPGSEVSVAALGMAARPSALRERVEAALRGGSFRPARGGVSRALASVALGTLTLGAPAVATDPDGAGLAAAFAAFAADAVDAPANASSAPAAPRRHRAAMRGLLAALQTEHTSLLAEAEHVRALLHDVVPTRELAAAQAALTARLAALARMRERVEAALAPTDSPER